jgi:hypothetical protein
MFIVYDECISSFQRKCACFDALLIMGVIDESNAIILDGG